jgi:multidrug resistance efflux pump
LSAKRVECRLAAILASDNATGNFIEIVQCVPARIALPADAQLTWFFRPRPSITVSVDTRAGSSAIAAISHDPVVDSARAKPAARASVIGW